MRPKASYANVTATVALVLALGSGGVIAATTITGKDIKNGSLTSADVKQHSLLAKDLKAGQLSAAKGVSDSGTTPLTLKVGQGWTTIAELQTKTTVAGLFMFSGSVEEQAPGTNVDDGVVQLRIVHNGHVHVLPSRNTVGPGDSELGLALFQCNESPGTHTVQLQAMATGANVDVGARNFALAETAHLP